MSKDCDGLARFLHSLFGFGVSRQILQNPGLNVFPSGYWATAPWTKKASANSFILIDDRGAMVKLSIICNLLCSESSFGGMMFQTNDKLICNKTVVKRDFTGACVVANVACFVPLSTDNFFSFVGAEVNFGLRRPKLSSTLCGLSATRSFRVVYVHTPAGRHNGKIWKNTRSRFSTICHRSVQRIPKETARPYTCRYQVNHFFGSSTRLTF